jgi:hypothetical protein
MGPNQAAYSGPLEETEVNFKMAYIYLCYKATTQTNILHIIKKGLTGSNYTNSLISNLVQPVMFSSYIEEVPTVNISVMKFFTFSPGSYPIPYINISQLISH